MTEAATVVAEKREPENVELPEIEEPVAEIPLHGAVLGQGDHLLEVELARPAKPEVFLQALKSMGFVDVLIDQSTLRSTTPEPPIPAHPGVEDMWAQWREWGHFSAGAPPTEGPLRFRFVARVEAPIRILDTPWVRWLYAQTSSVDLFADPSKAEFEPVELHPGTLYELRFLARMRVQPTRRVICALLATMRFRPLKITSLRRNIRLPGLPGTNFVLWYGLARWEGPDSYVSAEDPFFFEVVRPVG